MKFWKTLAICSASLAVLLFSMPDYADAARMGGGRSFGSSSVMKRPAPTAPKSSSSFGSGTTMNRNSTMNSQTGAATASRGAFGGMGGLFGGLLAGTMLGSLLGGGYGVGTGGAAGSFMDLLLLGLLVYFGVKLFRRFREKKNTRESYQNNSYSRSQYQGQQYQPSDYAGGTQGSSLWDSLRSSDTAIESHAENTENLDVPVGFNTDEFLRGAKMAYTRMQQSWDKRDLNDIAQFATEDVMKELRQQAQDDPNPGKTEILMINASVLEVKDEGQYRRVAVYFDVLMREDPNAPRSEQVREVWYFVGSDALGESWKLDGIQQMV